MANELSPEEVMRRYDRARGTGQDISPEEVMRRYDRAQGVELRASLETAVDTNPQQFARERVVARALDVTPAAVAAMPQQAERRAKLQAIEQDTADTPVLRQQMLRPEFAKLVHEDVDSMGTLERVAKRFKESQLGASAIKGTYDLGAAGLRLLDAVNPFTTSEADLAVVYKNNPAELKRQLNGPATALSRYARQLTQKGEAALAARSDENKAAYDSLEYATLDPQKSALLSPTKVAGDIVASLPTTVATAATFYLTRNAAVTARQEALAAGLTEQQAVQAGVQAAQRAAATVGAASEGAVGYAQNYNQTREQAAKVDPIKRMQSPEYQALLAQGFTPMAASIKLETDAAETAGVIGGVADAAVNAVAGKFLGKLIAESGPALKKIGGAALQEGITEGVQSPLEQLGTNIGMAKLDPTQSLTDGLGEALVQGVVLGAVTGGAFGGVNAVADRLSRDTVQAQRTVQQAEAMQQLGAVAAAVKNQVAAPEMLREMAEALTEDGQLPDHVYVSAEVLNQLGVTEALSQAIPAVSDQLQQAVTQNADVQIPMADYMASVAGSDLNQQLVEHLRFDPDGMTLGESQLFQQKAGEALEQEYSKLFERAEVEDAFKASSDRVRDRVLTQLTEANRFPDPVNRVKATFTAAYYATRAAQLGVMPEDYFNQNPLTVVGTQPTVQDGKALGQEAPAFKAWFRQSKVVDAEGKPLVVYHGARPGSDIKVFEARKGDGIYFTPDTSYAESYTSELFGDTGAAGAIYPAYVSLQNPLIVSGAWGSPEVEAFLNRGLDAEALKAQGYDGAMLYIDGQLDQLMAFSPEQIKSVNNSGAFDPNDPDILNQSQPELPALIATHNLTEANLLHAAKIGGLPVPSLAVVKADAPMTNFGEITLIAPKDLIDPKGYAKAQTFGADIYSPRYPSIENEVNTKSVNTLNSVLAQAIELFGDARMGGKFDAYTLRSDPRDVLANSSVVRAQFLLEQGREADDLIVRKQAEPLPNGMGAYENDDRTARQLVDDPEFAKAVREAYAADMLAAFAAQPATAQELIDELIDPQQFRRVVSSYAGKVRSHVMGKASNGQIDEYATRDNIDLLINSGLSDQFQDYVDALMSDMDIKERIFDGYTPSGNRRYMPHTIENVVKILKKELRGGENFNYGVGSLRAKFTPKFKSVKEIKANSDKLVSKAEFNQVKQEVDDAFSDITSKLSAFYPYRDLRTETVMAVIEEAPAKGLDRALAEYDLRDVDDETKQLIVEFITRMRNMPTEYFESKVLRSVDLSEFAGAVVPENISAKALKVLRDAGIQNIRYYPAGNDEARAGEIKQFNDQLFQAGDKARGMYSPAFNLITLLEGSDLSTFLHEAGHAFLQMDTQLAARLLAKDELTDGERQIVGDVSTTLRWFGIQGDPVTQLATWSNLSVDEFRAHHEKLAEAFEAYLSTGKAPSLELQPLFNRFASWLRQVYKAAKDYLTNAGKTITPEIEQVFDRMLATPQQIELAQQTRSLLPLFENEGDAAKVGMTPDALARYHESAKAATEEAINSVQARSVRDIKWLSNARSKALKDMQKQAEDLRRDVRTVVRTEVMSQPVYRAWAFLTGRMTDEDKVGGKPREAAGVDARRDSLFVAIAKLGGLDIAQARAEWGLDPKETIAQPVFGKPVLRRDGGLGIDGMAELLAEQGYLTTDQNGKWDLHEFSDRFFEELRGNTQFSMAVDYDLLEQDAQTGVQLVPEGVGAGRISREAAEQEFGKDSVEFQRLEQLKMLRQDGYHPAAVADLFGFDSADALAKAIAEATPPKEEVDGRTDQRMLEEHAELATPEAIQEAADRAIHNEAHARMVATQLLALDRALKARAATGETDRRGRPITYAVLPKAARQYAEKLIAGLRVRDVKPGQYASAAARAATASKKAFASGDLEVAAAESRNQLLNIYASKAAYEAKEEIRKAVEYLRSVQTDAARKRIGAEYMDQIDALLEKVDLRKGATLKELQKRENLRKWIERQEAEGLEVDIPDYLREDAYRTSFKNMTVEEMRGLVDTVKMIAHLGTFKQKLLTAKSKREWAAIRDEMQAKLIETSKGRSANPRTPTDALGRKLAAVRRFGASHIKAATWARIFDGGMDGGPWWEYLVRPANERADMETRMRAEATERLMEIMAPLFKAGALEGKRTRFDSIGRSLNRMEVIAMALNTGNEGNLQRLLGGEGWSLQQIQPVLATLTAADWATVQAVWDHFESYRPLIAAKERRVYGKEPNWVEPKPMTVRTSDGQTVELRGGYYPIKYDPAASMQAEQNADADSSKQAMTGAKSTATTRRSFTKDRADIVEGRPLLLNLSGLFSGTNEVIHDVVWHEWVIDAQRMMRSKTLDAAIRETYGAEVKAQLKKWVNDIAKGDAGAQEEMDSFATWMRRSVSVAGLGFNVGSALLQLTGFTNSIVRVGVGPMLRAIPAFLADPRGSIKQVSEMSSFMAERGRTQFRDLNEIANKVSGQNKFTEVLQLRSYLMIQVMQRLVDTPTWLAAYEKAVAAGEGDDRAVALADQAVRDSQGSGLWADQSGIERGGALAKFFTVFYSYMNTVLNSTYASGMTAKGKGDAIMKVATLTVLVPVLTAALKDAMTPDGGDDDELEKILRKYGAEVVASNMGLFVGVREFAGIGKGVVEGKFFGYSGPAGLRLVDTVGRFTQQAYQGDMDKALVKSAIDMGGVFMGLPAAQINRTIEGWIALDEGQTDNPAALVMGYKKD